MAIHDDPKAGVINPDELYTLQAFTRRLGIKAATVRAARRAGLRVYYAHRHGYIHGRDWIEYVLASGDRRNGDSVSEAG
ncbi:MAG: hypothetical protein KatS3mg105_4909 [Gemmatales bacterium]|nr:MAG: hypothetical protein KatS3mg105_4909 [Gemmatales bacterium]